MSDSNVSEEKPEVVDTIDKEEQSALFINQAHKQFKMVAYGLSDRKKRAVARVLESVLFEPLEQVELIGKDEKELFAICQKVMYHKGIVLNYAFNKAKTKLEKGETNEQEK